MSSPISKVCSVCGELKLLSQFGAKTTGKHGREARCRDCRSAYRRAARIDSRRGDVTLRVNRRVAEEVRSLSQRQGIPMIRLTTMLLAYGIRAVYEGRLNLSPKKENAA